MGLIIIPIWIIALIMFIVSIVNLYKEALATKINLKVILIGLLLSIILISLHLIYWKIDGKVFALIPSIIFLLTCIILPTALYPLVKNMCQKIGSIILISIITSSIILILSNQYLFNISDLLNIKKHY